jgi:hypothetical protein
VKIGGILPNGGHIVIVLLRGIKKMKLEFAKEEEL